MKSCKGCGIVKPLAEFYFHEKYRTKDKRLGKCKACCSHYVRTRYAEHRDKMRAIGRRRYKARVSARPVVAVPVIACERCGERFEASYRGAHGELKVAESRRFCSTPCRAQSAYRRRAICGGNRRRAVGVPRPCVSCGVEFVGKRRTSRFCSKRCCEKARIVRRKDYMRAQMREWRHRNRTRYLETQRQRERPRDPCALALRANSTWRSNLKKRVGSELLADAMFMRLAAAARKLRLELRDMGIGCNQ